MSIDNHRHPATTVPSQPGSLHVTLQIRQKKIVSSAINVKTSSASPRQELHSALAGGWRPQRSQPGAETIWDQPTLQLKPMAAQVRYQNASLPQLRIARTWQALHPWFYRCWLLGTTLLLTFLLLQLQAVLDSVPVRLSGWQIGVQWAELIWLAPVPLAIALWLGWMIFAGAVQADPAPMEVPFVTSHRGVFAFMTPKPVRQVFRFVTRGDNVEILHNSVQAVHQAFRHYALIPGPYLVEVISDCPVALGNAENARTRIYVVPPNYVTSNRSRFKARALAYVQQIVRPLREDWYIYLDEESMIDEFMLAGIYRFVERSLQAEAAREGASRTGKKHSPAGLIGQGAILYQGGNWFFRGADALRTADDLGRFRLQYALGMPLFGVHGSYLVIRGIDDARLSFDVGATNSITEDVAWSLRAWSQGFRFEWVEGYLHEQPPQRIMDFVKQRSRWLSGIRQVLRDTEIPLRYRLCPGIFTALWQLAFLPFLVSTIALFIHASPFGWMRLPADFAWATFVLAYFQGIDVLTSRTERALRGNSKEQRLKILMMRAVSWPLVLCGIWYSLLEAAGVLYSLRGEQGFFVIQKPILTTPPKRNTEHGV